MKLTLRAVTVLVLAALAAPLGGAMQQAGSVYRIGYLSPRPGIELPEKAFREGLRELGYVEGQNLVIEWRFAKDGRADVSRRMATELVRLNVDCILTIGMGAAVAAREATTTIPIVIGTADDDPVRYGLIASFARPGGNVTGIVNLGEQLAGKRLQLIKETIPHASRVAIFSHPGRTPGAHVRETQAAARGLGIQLQSLEIQGPEALDHAFNAAVKGRAEALVVVGTGWLNSHRARIITLATKARLPAIHTSVQWVQEGGLMSYASDPVAQYRRAASYVDRIFKGAKPADLSVEQPTKFELVVNLKTAKTLGLTIPPSLLARADQVIGELNR